MKKTPLPIEEVRRLARECSLREIQFNETSHVLAFLSEDDTRFNVYYTTGTVGTYLLHPRQGKTQLFRRNVSLSLLRQVFVSPRIHTDFGYHHRHDYNGGTTSSQSQRKRARTNSGDWNTGKQNIDDIDEEESAAKKQLKKLLAEKSAVEREIDEVQGIIDDHKRRRVEEREREEEERQRQKEERRRNKAIERENKEEEMRKERGVCASWCLKESKDFKKNFDEETSCVAVGGDGTHLCLDDSGTYSYSTGLPDGLFKLLHTRAPSHPSPDYIAMGSMNRYYVQFTNGKSQWEGPDEMSKLLQKDDRRVKSVAFGEGFEDYFVVFEGGGYESVGCPSGLDSKMKARRRRGDIEKVTLGPNGEWGLWAKNGKAWWGNTNDDMGDEIASIQKKGETITDVLFGNDGYYFIRHT